VADAGYKKVGSKARRGRKHKLGRPHSGHRKADAYAPGGVARRKKVDRRRRLQELRTPEIDW
jgi:hypothetical protein